jgi:hypothetical protein
MTWLYTYRSGPTPVGKHGVKARRPCALNKVGRSE